jgi:hypothetical protein
VTSEPEQEHKGTDSELERTSAAARHRWRRRSVRARTVTAAATVAVLALGGTAAYAATSGNPGNDASASPSSSASPGGRHGHGMGLGRGIGVHGEATVKDRDTGKWVVRVWQRGTVEKVDGDQVTVKSADGTEWTWTVGPATKVHRDGTPGSGAEALKKGGKALLVGTRSDDGTRTAQRVHQGTWKKKGRGDHRDRSNREWRKPAPAASPSGSGAAA